MTENYFEKRDNHVLRIFELTKRKEYIDAVYKISSFVREIYRTIEPSHFEGQLIIFKDLGGGVTFDKSLREHFYDKGILTHEHDSLIFQLHESSDTDLPSIWVNADDEEINKLLSINENFIAYVFEGEKEYFLVNTEKVDIPNGYSCPSIFALQYHQLNEALLDYKNEKVRTSNCEFLKNCWHDEKRIYFKNKPENCMQISLKQFLGSRIRGVTIDREFTLGSSKPVDVRVSWREANRDALIEVKWLGKSIKNGNLSTAYANGRANDGMEQIKGYIDLGRSDTPTIITKGYLVIIDGRRKRIASQLVKEVSRKNGMHYAGKDVIVKDENRYWETYSNIERPYRMFVEPVCGK